MREYTKRQAGQRNTFGNIKKDRGKNLQQLKEANKLHVGARVSEGPCELEEIQNKNSKTTLALKVTESL